MKMETVWLRGVDMDSRKFVCKETAIVAAGQAVCVALMFCVYALLGLFSTKMLLGGVAGALAALANFFFMAMVASMAADKAEQQNVAEGQKLIKGAYPIRLLLLAVILFACAKSGYFDVVALVLPLVFVRPILTVAELLRKREGRKWHWM